MAKPPWEVMKGMMAGAPAGDLLKAAGVAMPEGQRGQGAVERTLLDSMFATGVVKLPMKGVKIAKDLGVIYNGPQLGPKGEVSIHLFTDAKTGSTFSAKTLAKPNVEAGLKEMQEKFTKVIKKK